ncbi:MAG: RsmE family RNA methyltransferase [Bryobacteraceae bacterium]|nr:RsmE family RNA methyltransferase [Bryobacteraceae bacterium]
MGRLNYRMARRLFFVDEVRGERAELEGEDARHLRRVLRAEVGQRFEISDNRELYLAEIDGFGKDLISFRVLERLDRPGFPVPITLAAALIKFDHFEWILEKAAELGVDTVVPLATVRTERGLDLAAQKRSPRWRRILLEASQQSRRARLPILGQTAHLEEILPVDAEHRLFLEENSSQAAPLVDVLSARGIPASAALLVGPEGGWVESERALATASGWTPVSLGPQVLRAETAALAALAVLTSMYLRCRM